MPICLVFGRLLVGAAHHILLPSARHLEERPTVSQSVSQAVSRARRQADRQAETHSLAFFSCGPRLQTLGSTCSAGTLSGPAPARIPALGSVIAGSADRLLSPFLNSTLVAQIPLTTNFSAPPKKNGIQFQGVRGLKIKKIHLGYCCVGQNNVFTRGWTSNIMPWGMLRE